MFLGPPAFEGALAHLFSFVSRPVDCYREPMGTWRGGAALFALSVDYHPNLRLVLDVYAARQALPVSALNTQPFVEGTRYEGLHSGNVYGPVPLPPRRDCLPQQAKSLMLRIGVTSVCSGETEEFHVTHCPRMSPPG